MGSLKFRIWMRTSDIHLNSLRHGLKDRILFFRCIIFFSSCKNILFLDCLYLVSLSCTINSVDFLWFVSCLESTYIVGAWSIYALCRLLGERKMTHTVSFFEVIDEQDLG